MSYIARRAKRRHFDVWPGYVDALSSMLMMIAVVLMIMVAAQFYLSSAVADKDIELGQLSEKLKQLSSMLSFEKESADVARSRAAQKPRTSRMLSRYSPITFTSGTVST